MLPCPKFSKPKIGRDQLSTVDGSEIWLTSWYGKYPIICKVLYIQKVVVWDFVSKVSIDFFNLVFFWGGNLGIWVGSKGFPRSIMDIGRKPVMHSSTKEDCYGLFLNIESNMTLIGKRRRQGWGKMDGCIISDVRTTSTGWLWLITSWIALSLFFP